MICSTQILENMQSSSFLGLTFTDGIPALDKRFFTCCGAQGYFYDEIEGAQRVCNLRKRLSLIEKLAKSFEATWQIPFSLNLELFSSTELTFIRRTFDNYRSNRQKKGHAFTTFSKAIEPSIKLWHLAFFASWHYAIPTHIITLSQKTSLNTAFLTRGQEHPLIFIEQKGSFFNAEIATEFSAIVNWCDQHEIGIWIDLFQEAPKAPQQQKEAPATDVMTAFQRRIDAQKNKPPLSWVHADCKSRLRNICRNTSFYL